MKIGDAKAAWSAQIETLWAQKRTLAKLMKEQEEGGAGKFDRVELSKELARVDASYEEARKTMEGIIATETAIQNSEVYKQQSDALEKQADQMGKMMEIYRRIAKGGRVPPKDENALLNYSKELYMAAKMAAMMLREKDKDKKKYDSLLDEEDAEKGEGVDAAEAAANTEIDVAAPEAAPAISFSAEA